MGTATVSWTTPSSAPVTVCGRSVSRCSSSPSLRARSSPSSSRPTLALLADLIHNFGDAATAVPLGIAFALRSARAERFAGLAVVFAIFVSACVAGYEAISRLINPIVVVQLGALAAAGALGFAGNWVAAIVRTRAGRRLNSPG